MSHLGHNLTSCFGLIQTRIKVAEPSIGPPPRMCRQHKSVLPSRISWAGWQGGIRAPLTVPPSAESLLVGIFRRGEPVRLHVECVVFGIDDRGEVAVAEVFDEADE